MRSRLKTIAVRAGLFGLASTLCVLALELVLRWFLPQTTMYPRYDFLSETGIINHASQVIRHRRPGVFDYRYTVNAHRYRGPILPFAGERPRIVVLGDSYTFGIGVSDDQPYPYRLGEELKDLYEVVNLGNGGWGLTHEIARYLTFGQRFHPDVVVLQFSANDLGDNRMAPLVREAGEPGEFELTPVSLGSTGRFKKWLESSPRVYRLLAGHTQIYNLARDSVYRALAARDRRRNERDLDDDEQRYHLDLLRGFAVHLRDRGVRLVMISVQSDLERFPEVAAGVRRLVDERLLEYLETGDWFPREPAYASPEGHAWGERAHALVATHLATYLRRSSGAAATASR